MPILFAIQTSVDLLVQALNNISLVSLDGWKYSTDALQDEVARKDYSSQKYNDSHWKDLKIRESLFIDSCWMRKEIILPDRILGRPIEGPVRLLISVDDCGYLYIDGEERGYFQWATDIEISAHAHPGQRIVVLIKTINSAGPLQLLGARIEMQRDKQILLEIADLVLSLRVGQKLLSFDTYQTSSRLHTDPGIDKSSMDREEKIRLNNELQRLAEQIDLEALRTRDIERFRLSMEKVSDKLQPIDDFAKRFTLHFTANAHIDAAWLWRKKETVEVCANTFKAVLDMMETRPDFTYTQSSALFYEWMATNYPELIQRITARIEDGRWEISGGMWVEPDCNIPGGESWARHLLYAQRYFEQHFGQRTKIGWNPDSFGYNWNMPQLYKNGGIDAFITQKISWNDTNIFPHRVFWWEAPDGSRILGYFPFGYANTLNQRFQLVDWLRQFEANTGFSRMLVLYGVGDHGGGPDDQMLDHIDHMKNLAVFPKVDHGITAEYLHWLQEQDLSSIPVWNKELYLEYHRGTLTTHGKTKQLQRQSEILLTNAERASTIATLYSREYNHKDLEEAWRLVMLNQFHDVLPGTSIREVYLDAEEDYALAFEIGKFELEHSFKHIAEKIDTKGLSKGQPIIVWNTCGWTRSDIVRYSLQPGESYQYAVFDEQDKEIPSQVVKTGKYTREILFIAENMPALGYRLYCLRAQQPSIFPVEMKVSDRELENHALRVVIDDKSGWVGEIHDKKRGHKVLSGPGNQLQMFEDRPEAWDAWNIGLTGVEYSPKLRRIEVVETGPVRTVIRVHYDFLHPETHKGYPTKDFPSSFFTQDIMLYNGLDYVDFRTEIDWWEDNIMLKVAFKLNLDQPTPTYEIPFGTIHRDQTGGDPLEKAKWEVPSLMWADLSDRHCGVSLLNRSKYGYDAKANNLRLSLLRSPTWPDNTADRGRHSIEYALYAHDGSWKEGRSVQKGMEYNYPLLVTKTDLHAGPLPEESSFIQLEPANLALTTLKQAEDGSTAWIVRWYESEGQLTQAKLSLPFKPGRAVTTDFLEEDGSELEIRGNMVYVETPANSVQTVKIYIQ